MVVLLLREYSAVKLGIKFKITIWIANVIAEGSKSKAERPIRTLRHPQLVKGQRVLLVYNMPRRTPLDSADMGLTNQQHTRNIILHELASMYNLRKQTLWRSCKSQF